VTLRPTQEKLSFVGVTTSLGAKSFKYAWYPDSLAFTLQFPKTIALSLLIVSDVSSNTKPF
jgi:hypothetical protein